MSDDGDYSIRDDYSNRWSGMIIRLARKIYPWYPYSIYTICHHLIITSPTMLHHITLNRRSQIFIGSGVKNLSWIILHHLTSCIIYGLTRSYTILNHRPSYTILNRLRHFTSSYILRHLRSYTISHLTTS